MPSESGESRDHDGYRFTPREESVLNLVVGGLMDKEVADQLGISTLTAHKHVASILKKMGARSRTEAAVRAVREGIVD
jgi:DNA-binding NarL/FixJ family response regulator